MARQSECEHDIDFYRIVSGSGLSVTEQCSECGTRITSLSPKQKIEAELDEQKAEERKKRKAAKKRKATIAAKKEAEEDEDDYEDEELTTEDEDESVKEKFAKYFE